MVGIGRIVGFGEGIVWLKEGHVVWAVGHGVVIAGGGTGHFEGTEGTFGSLFV